MRNRPRLGAHVSVAVCGTLRASVGRRDAAAGQALLIAVLVLFAVATLAALFVGIVSSQLTQVTRQSDVVALRNIAEAGLRLANEQLSYSPKGADWRPDDSPYNCGDGQVTIEVTYGPAPDEAPVIQNRFLRIMSTAVFPDNPFLRHTIFALKPVLLTDYARFITDKDETNRTARLGVSGLQLGGLPRQDYVTYIGGPIRSNTHLAWYGQCRVSLRTTFDTSVDWRALGILRDDRIEIAGSMGPAPNSSALDVLTLDIDGWSARASNLFAPSTEQERYDYLNGFPWPPLGSGGIIPNSRAVLSDLPAYFTGDELLSPGLAVPRIRPPEIDAFHPDKDANRYLSLTRDSGLWRREATSGIYYNTGEFGWGWMNYGGIYIDNAEDIQYNHDLDLLRLNWTQSVGGHAGYGDERDEGVGVPPEGPADWWDRTGRYYAPPGVEIILHGEATCPYVEIIRHRLRQFNGYQYYWCDPDGAPVSGDLNLEIPDELVYEYVPAGLGACTPTGGSRPIGIYDGNRAVFPFPANGVIYTEGNARVRGVMPPARDNQGRVGTAIPLAEAPEAYLGAWDSMNGRTRRFDLQIVSGGTIYVEGDLLSPATARLAGMSPDDILGDRIYGSRIALLARDYVCLNTTALNPRPVGVFRPVAEPEADPEEEPVYRFYNDAQPVFSSSGDQGYLLLEGDTSLEANLPLGAIAWDPETDGPFPTDPAWISFTYTNSRLRLVDLAAELTDLRLMVGHSALWVEEAQPDAAGGIGVPSGVPPPGNAAPPGESEPDEPAVDLAVYINGEGPRPWSFDTSRYTFWRTGTGVDPSSRDESEHWYLDAESITLELGTGGDDWCEFLPDVNGYQDMVIYASATPDVSWLTGEDVIQFEPRVWPVRLVREGSSGPEVYDWRVYPKDLAYTLGPVAVAPPNRDPGITTSPDPLPVEIDALIYAQNGSWFVIPGRWFNEDPDEFGQDVVSPYPSYQEPLNISIRVYGAISENLPADLGSAANWTSKWGGPAGQGGEGFLTYAFDPLLRYPRRETTDRIGYLRFPNFPITSDLVIWGERVSGPAGT